MVPVQPGRCLAGRRGRQRGQPPGQAGVVAGQVHGLGQQAGRPFGLVLGPFGAGASAELGDLGVQGREPLVQRIGGGQSGPQPLRAAEPAPGQLVHDLLAQALERVGGEDGGRDQPGLVLVQAELGGLAGDAPLEEPGARQLPQRFDDLRQQQRVQLSGLARRGAQDGQDVLAGRPGRIRVGQGVHPAPRRGDRVGVQRPPVGQPEPAQEPEAGGHGVTEDDLGRQ